MSRMLEAQARLDAALQRLERALQVVEARGRAGAEARDRQIASLTAELATLRQDRDMLEHSNGLAAERIDAVIGRLRAAQG